VVSQVVCNIDLCLFAPSMSHASALSMNAYTYWLQGNCSTTNKLFFLTYPSMHTWGWTSHKYYFSSLQYDMLESWTQFTSFGSACSTNCTS